MADVVVRLRADLAAFHADVAGAAKQTVRQFEAQARVAADPFAVISAKMRSALASGVADTKVILADRQKLVAALDRELTLLRQKQNLTCEELAQLKRLTLERERQSSAIASGGGVGITRGTQEVVDRLNASQRRAVESAQLLGAQLGVHLPRSVQRFIAVTPAIGTALSAAFQVGVVAAIGTAIVATFPKIAGFIDRLRGITTALAEAVAKARELNEAILGIRGRTAEQVREELAAAGREKAAIEARLRSARALRALRRDPFVSDQEKRDAERQEELSKKIIPDLEKSFFSLGEARKKAFAEEVAEKEKKRLEEINKELKRQAQIRADIASGAGLLQPIFPGGVGPLGGDLQKIIAGAPDIGKELFGDTSAIEEFAKKFRDTLNAQGKIGQDILDRNFDLQKRQIALVTTDEIERIRLIGALDTERILERARVERGLTKEAAKNDEQLAKLRGALEEDVNLQVAEAQQQRFEKLVSTLGQAAGEVFDAMLTKGKGVFSSLRDFVQGIFQTLLRSLFTGLVEGLVSRLGGLLGGGGGGASGGIGGFFGNLLGGLSGGGGGGGLGGLLGGLFGLGGAAAAAPVFGVAGGAAGTAATASISGTVVAGGGTAAAGGTSAGLLASLSTIAATTAILAPIIIGATIAITHFTSLAQQREARRAAAVQEAIAAQAFDFPLQRQFRFGDADSIAGIFARKRPGFTTGFRPGELGAPGSTINNFNFSITAKSFDEGKRLVALLRTEVLPEFDRLVSERIRGPLGRNRVNETVFPV